MKNALKQKLVAVAGALAAGVAAAQSNNTFDWATMATTGTTQTSGAVVAMGGMAIAVAVLIFTLRKGKSVIR